MTKESRKKFIEKVAQRLADEVQISLCDEVNAQSGIDILGNEDEAMEISNEILEKVARKLTYVE